MAVVGKYRPLIFGGALVLSIAGTAMGFLPGTKPATRR